MGALSLMGVGACFDGESTSATRSATQSLTRAVTPPNQCATCPVPPPPFLVRSYQGRTRCLDYEPGVVGSQVFINDCSKANPIVVEEVDAEHTVVLHAGTKVLGVRDPWIGPLPSGTSPVQPAADAELALEVQEPMPANLAKGSPGARRIEADQYFALDGDSIIQAASMPIPATAGPVFVVKVQNARGALHSPVVVGRRALADDEFWDFVANDGSNRDPTTGFVHVSPTVSADLVGALANATPGTVIVLDVPEPIYFQGPVVPETISVPRVTIRGNRRGTNLGPVLQGSCNFGEPCPYENETYTPPMFEIAADYVRIAGVTMVGPTDSTTTTLGARGITVDGWYTGKSCPDGSLSCLTPGPDVDPDPANPFAATIDHSDLSRWPDAAIESTMPDSVATQSCPAVPTGSVEKKVHVAKNFLHHNEKHGLGYGVSSGRTDIEGNTFLMNRHAIASGSASQNQYTALYNLVLSSAPDYPKTLDHYEQDFDMHGSFKSNDSMGGIAGGPLDIGWNTFLGDNRFNFELRGQPCEPDFFHDNRLIMPECGAIHFIEGEDAGNSISYYCQLAVEAVPGTPQYTVNYDGADFYDGPVRLQVVNDSFSITNPTKALRVGDFDGDGVDDLFLATGAAWYFAPGGMTEWRFLSAEPETTDQLLFGDFDADGRTDVVALHGNTLVASWGGVSTWERLVQDPSGSSGPATLAQLAVGDFDGDHRSDVFFADGVNWYVWYGDPNDPTFVFVQTSSHGVPDLRFGDFDDDGTTDVFSVVSGWWRVSEAPLLQRTLFTSWQPLQPQLTSDVQGLFVADFNGDGFADVASDADGGWRISYSGTQKWSYVSEPTSLSSAAGIGRFRDASAIQIVRPTDVLLWGSDADCGQNGNYLCIVPAAILTPEEYGRTEMR